MGRLNITTTDSSKPRELGILKLLDSRGGLSSNCVAQLYDAFTRKSPNGVHQCLPFELTGIFRIPTQLLKAVRFIQNAGICHGDVSGRNIAFTYNQPLIQTKKGLFEIGSPELNR
ncbi:hypothetical protein N7467_008718 [Penicillium canescens]|nr:hypothetical protein N7467_008718 [Penicillium canescens]